MKRRFTIVAATLALLAIFIAPMGMMGQTKTENFETAPATTNYQGTVTVTSAQSDCGIGWSIYYGAVSTTGPIAGSKSAQMRWYKNSSTKYPYLESTTAVEGLTKVEFKAKVGNTNLKMDVHYSLNRTDWTALASAVTFSNTDVTNFSYNIPSGGKYIKISVSSSSTTTSSSYLSLLVDNVIFTYSPSVPQHTVTYHANVTGTTDIVETYNEGEDVTVADNTFTNTGYAFTEWNTEEDGSGDSYSPGDEIEDIDDDIDLYAQWEETDEITLTFPLNSNPGGWPTDNPSTLTNYTYSLNGVSYTFALKNSKCNSGYLMMTAPAVLGLPAIEGYKLTKVVASNSSTCSTTTQAGISSSASQASYISGGAVQTWSQTSSQYTYSLTSTEENTMYYLYVTNKNAQVIQVALTYEPVSSVPAIATTTTINVPQNFNTDVYTSTTAGTLTATVTENANNTAISGATVTWASSDPSIATINASGVVTLVATGTTTITASYAGVANQYQASSTTYSLTVTSSAPVPDVTFVAGTDNGNNTAFNNPDSMEKSGVTVSGTNAAFGQNPYRIYASSTTTISAPGYTITSIVFNIASGYNASDLALSQGATGSYSDGTWTGSASSVSFSASAQVRVSSIDIWMTPNTSPTITCNPAAFSDFFYLASSQGPSAAQTISVSGVNLTDNITVALGNNSNFEISTSENGTYNNSLPLAQTSGSVASTTIYVRLKGSLQAGNYSDDLSLTSSGATTVTLALAGKVVTPMTVAEAIAAINNETDHSVTGAYVAGIVSQVDSYDGSFHSITYHISDDGTTTTQLQVFGGKGLDGANFSALSDLTVGDEVVVYGNLTLYNNSVYEFESNNHLVYYNHTLNPVINANNITLAYNETEGSVTYSVVNSEEGTNLTASCSASWISSLTVSANAVTFFATQNDNQAPRTANITLSYTGATNKVITITQTNFTASSGSGSGQFVRITNLNDLTDGCKVIIASRYDNNANAYKAMPNVLATNTNHGRPTGVAFTSTTQGGDEFLPATIANDYSSYCWTVNITNDGYTFTRADGQILGWTSGTDFSYANGIHRDWTIERITSGSAAMVPNYTGFLISNVNTTTRAFAYNGNEFGVYSTTNSLNTSGYSYHLDFFVETGAAERHTLTINRYTESGVGQNANPSNGWYLIASPVQGVTPSATNGFLTSAYDLYRFDQVGDAIGNEWLNYEVTPFNLISGQGYLYASSTDTELEFEGASYTGNGQVTLYKKDCSNASGNFEGWNLVGNPFPHTAYIDRDCYVMNQNRNQIIATSNREVAIMQGLFVVANSDGEKMTFSTTNPNNSGSKVVMNIIDNQGVADRAIVRFGEGQQLPKFQLFGNTTKVYFTEGHQDYAVVRSANQGELPVNFKASSNGRYTMSFDVENLDMNYLHLIDNKTGNDVDLLATPSYTFQANSSDYESRFRLVFDANTVNENNTTTTFAYYNGSEWIINNSGNATLQVIDMMGRVLSSQTLNGNANVNINQPAGIYMLRLVNGENVMVQKVVVR